MARNLMMSDCVGYQGIIRSISKYLTTELLYVPYVLTDYAPFIRQGRQPAANALWVSRIFLTYSLATRVHDNTEPLLTFKSSFGYAKTYGMSSRTRLDWAPVASIIHIWHGMCSD